MNFRKYAHLLLSHWQCVAIFTLGGVIVAAGLSLMTKPQFSATAEIFLSTPRFNNVGSANTSPYQSDAFTQERARSYVELATREDLAARVITKLGIDMPPAELAANTTASVLPDTVLIDVSVSSSSPTESRVLTDAVTAELMRNIATLESRGGLGVPVVEPILTQAAHTPASPSEPTVAIYVSYGAAVGFLIGITVATWLDSRRIDEETIEAISARPVLGRSLLKDVDSRSATDDAFPPRHLREWRAIAQRVGAEIERSGDKVLLVTAADRATTCPDTAALLASSFAETGHRVVLLTTRTRSSVPPAGGAPAMERNPSIRDALRRSPQDNLWYLDGARFDSDVDWSESDAFRAAIGELRATHDLVIVDTVDSPRRIQSASLHEVIDSLVLVLRHGQVTRRKLASAVSAVARHHVPLLGSIVSSDAAGRHRTTTRDDVVTNTKGADR